MSRSLLIFVVLALVACSTSSDFVVLNSSGESIEVKYKWKRCPPAPPNTSVDKLSPAKLSAREFERSSKEWIDLEPNSFDDDGCAFVVRVLPNEALRVFRAFNYTDRDDEYSDFRFDIQDLSINGRNGVIRLEGKQTQTTFKKLDTGHYVIEYQ